MATFQKFEDMEAWQRARVLTNQIYDVTSQDSFRRDLNLVDQLRRAAISIMSNIAEGYERDGTKEFLHFLSIAKGSAGEVRAQLYIALDRKYISSESFQTLNETATQVSRMITGLMKYLRQSDLKGIKHKPAQTT